jgi:hypothetical protein
MYFFHLGYPVERGSIQEIAALHVYRKRRIIDVLKVIVDVKAAAGGDKKDLRKTCEAFLDEAMPELKGLREASDKKMSQILEAETQKTYSIRKSEMAGRIAPSGRKKWRRR